MDNQNLRELFISELGWNNPDQPDRVFEIDGHIYTLNQVAGYKGLRVWFCTQLPTRKIQRVLDDLIGQDSHERLVIFADETRQEWRWPRRAQLGGTNAKLLVHQHVVGQADPNLARQLSTISIDFDDDISLVALLDKMRLAFDAEAEAASVQAARLMGTLYQELDGAGATPHDATLLLARLLFLLFGDDSGMWERGLFERYLHGQTTAETLNKNFADLFEVLNTEKRPLPDRPHLSEFRYINGGLFADTITIVPLTSGFRDALLVACEFDWAIISPAVFGSMFQTVKDKKSRSHGGEHYTTESNILKTINPLILDDIRARLHRAWDDRGQLTRIHNELGRLRFIDPACGCGNFLIVTYRELRAIELDLLLRYRELEMAEKGLLAVQQSFDVTGDIKVTLDHFYGIELEEWPARIAETAMLLVDHLANQRMEQDFGKAPDRLPIRIAPTIVHENAIQIDWKDVLPPSDDVVVVGNPPFVAMHKMDKQQQIDRARAFGELPESRGHRTGRLDYVASWYAKAISYARGTAARVAFVSTNSLMQGDSARVLDPIFTATGNDILFAHRSFMWETEANDGAAVACVIVGFASGRGSTPRRIFDHLSSGNEQTETVARRISCYLIDTDLPGPAKRTSPLLPHLPRMSKGSQPTDGGNLLISLGEKQEVLNDPIAAKYMRPWAQSAALLDGEQKWCLWLVDSSAYDREQSAVLRRRLEAVSNQRSASPTPSVKAAAATPWLFTQLRQPDQEWLGIPRHSSEHRACVPMSNIGADVIAGDALAYIENCPLWVFAFLQSAAFTDWIKTFSGALENRLRISPDMTYNVFPFIEPHGENKVALEASARQLIAARASHPGRTLASLYDAKSIPTNLLEAHQEIDDLVDSLYGLHRPPASERILVLLAKHHQIVTQNSLIPTTSTRRRGRKG